MAPWWNKHHPESGTCTGCGRAARLHDGLCNHCRRQGRSGTHADRGHDGRETPSPVEPTLEPPHDRPWRHEGD